MNPPEAGKPSKGGQAEDKAEMSSRMKAESSKRKKLDLCKT
jgi:hypothetical protein